MPFTCHAQRGWATCPKRPSYKWHCWGPSARLRGPNPPWLPHTTLPTCTTCQQGFYFLSRGDHSTFKQGQAPSLPGGALLLPPPPPALLSPPLAGPHAPPPALTQDRQDPCLALKPRPAWRADLRLRAAGLPRRSICSDFMPPGPPPEAPRPSPRPQPAPRPHPAGWSRPTSTLTGGAGRPRAPPPMWPGSFPAADLGQARRGRRAPCVRLEAVVQPSSGLDGGRVPGAGGPLRPIRSASPDTKHPNQAAAPRSHILCRHKLSPWGPSQKRQLPNAIISR